MIFILGLTSLSDDALASPSVTQSDDLTWPDNGIKPLMAFGVNWQVYS